MYGILNKEWAPSTRTPQPAYQLQQKATYLEVMAALLKAKADPNARLKRSLWYTTYNRDNLRVDFTGATPFFRAAYATDVAAMKLLLAAGADPKIGTIKPVARARRGGGGAPREDPSGLPPVPDGGPGVLAIHAASGVGYGQGFAANDHRHVPDGWLPSVKFLIEELGADVNARDFSGYTPLHHAAARGDNEMIKYLVSKGADVTAVARTGQTALEQGQADSHRARHFEGSEQAGHAPPSFAFQFLAAALCAWALAISASTLGKIRLTISATPSAVGCMPSANTSLGFKATPSRKNG